MKLQIYGIMMVMVSFLVCAQSDDVPAYQNQITDMQEIFGTTRYTLTMTCSEQHPIIVYAPESFSQSQDVLTHRYLLPNTTVSDNVDHDVAQVQQIGRHVEVLLHGKMLLHSADNFAVVFVMQVIT